MTESKLEKLTKTKKHSKANVITITVIVGFIILIVCQSAFLGFTMKERARTTSTTQDGSNRSSNIALTASNIQLVACSDDDLTDAVSAVKRAIVNIDVAPANVGSANRRGGPALSFDMPSTAALQTNEETLGSGVIIDARGYILT